MSGQILDYHVYTLVDTVLIKSSWIYAKMFVTMKQKTDLKVGYIGKETRSLGQILEKWYVFSSRHSFKPVCMKLCQNVWHHVMSDKIETGSSQVKK